MRDVLYACCPMHSTILGGKVGGKCSYYGSTLFLSDSFGAPLKVDPFDFSRLPAYRDPMFEMNPGARVFVELGTQRGFTAHRAVIHLPKATVHCVDPWFNFAGKPEYVGDMDLCHAVFQELHKENLASGRVIAHKGFSWDIAETFDEPIDFLWIDGDHTYDGLMKDLELWVPKVVPGGLIVGDNHEMPEVAGALKTWAEKHGYTYEVGGALKKARGRRKQFWFKKKG